ncbi:membrane serine peptidase [Psychromonas sp. CNPT3]|uniref:rhomboid family intramembrane serine protease GlpG n=1 Tax=Psychromonas sp. CNPT3 TaxID=314282 RepID=UPI00006E98FB|nr:rhomboid family intramembrane serine protease GlpG [Psychromonas sp. CNPT3]AGH82287.1 membrane serine peptidase [Psychromonas sp. CNPT3]
MFRLYYFQNLRIAQAFSDHLNTLDIDNKIESDEFNYVLILLKSDQQEQAQHELDAFLENPNADKYLSASWSTGSTKQVRNSAYDTHENLLNNFIAHAGILTHSVLGLCVFVFILMNIGFSESTFRALAFFVNQPFDLSQSWRFISPAFLHFSLLHIVFNLLWWWQLAGVIEKQQGSARLLILFVFSAIASNLAQYFLVSPYFGGLSGVVYTLVGYCWLSGRLDKSSLVNLPQSYFLFLLFWLALGFVDILPVNVANYAHLVGLLAGLIMAILCHYLFHKKKESKQ